MGSEAAILKMKLSMFAGAAVVLATAIAACARADEAVLVLQANVAAINPGDVQAAVQADDDPRLAALRNQYQPLLKVELSFANRVCQWTAEQRKTAIEAANAWLREFARDNAKNQQAFQGGFVVFAGNGPFGGVAAAPDPPEKGLREKLRDAMTEEQKAKYEAEKAKRENFQAEAQIDSVIAIMDQRLNLSPDQRRALQRSLRKNWKQDWAPPLQMFIQMSEYMPAVPDEFVVPHLTPEQRVQWQGMQKLSARGIVFGGGAFGNPSQTIDDIDLNEGQEKK
jgi:hypothetical protein